jgi:hypothetical protein
MWHRLDTVFVFVTTLAIGVGAPMLAPPYGRAADGEFFFYSPQVGTGNLSQLKQTADHFLRDSETSLSFQPFARFEDLQREFGTHRPAFLVVPDWIAMDHCLGEELRPLARPVRDGRVFDRRALVAASEASSATDIDGGSIAATVPAAGRGSGSETLARFRREHPDVRVIPVPKDIDALLAVGFGQVDGAFVSMTQFELLAAVNPALTGSLHEIGYSIATPFPAVYATQYADAGVIATLKKALEGGGHTESGQKIARLLGYDGWQPVSEHEPPIAAGRCGGDAEARP